MDFINPGLAAGVALAVLPILIHLILREKPRREPFPALRLLRYRQRSVTRRLKLRHLLLLACRVLAIVLISLALARPRLTGASGGMDVRAPAAVAMVFDTSMSMEYSHGEQTSFDRAREAARSVLEELPDDSEVLVIDAANPEVSMFMRPVEALDRIDALRLSAAAGSLNGAILEGLEQLRTATLDRKELYVLTDFMSGAIDTAGAEAIQEASSRLGGAVAIVFVDVGTSSPTNAAIENCRPTSDSVPASAPVTLRTRVSCLGEEYSGRLELYVDGQLRGQQPVQVRPELPVEHDFVLRGLPAGFHQGEVRLEGPERGLAFDDRWFFTVEVREPTEVAVVSEDRGEAEALLQALAPEELRRLGKERHRVTFIQPRRLRGLQPAEYDVVYLLDVPSPTHEDWLALGSFVRSGGGVGVFLGKRVQPAAYQTTDALVLLPAVPERPEEPDEVVHLEAVLASHPAVRLLHEWDRQALGRVVVYRYWTLRLQDPARTVLRFTNGAPALVERLIEPVPNRRMGTVAVFATPPTVEPVLERWNDLPQSPATFVILMDQLTLHLSGVAARRWNWTVGADLVLQLQGRRTHNIYRLVGPEQAAPVTGKIEGGQNVLVLSSPNTPGHYRLVLGTGQETEERRFSLNVDRRESRLERLSEGEVLAMFPEGMAIVARGTEELSRVAEQARTGRELFPYLATLLLLVFAVEHWLANRFYSVR